MKTSSKKQKGRTLQYWVCKKICNLFNIEFIQSNDLCPIHSREMGQSGTDICIRDKYIYNDFIYDIECKNTESVSLYAYIRQAKSNTAKNRQWMVVHKKNRHDPIVILDANHFFNLLSKLRINNGIKQNI